MSGKVNTNTLMKRLFKAADLDTYFQKNGNQLVAPGFPAMLSALCVIDKAQIERTYGHQLFNGTRRPSRDKVLQLAIGLGLDVDETQALLRAAGKSLLYPRLKRDAVILYGIQKGLPVLTVQEILTKYELTLLGGQKNGGE